MSGRTNLLINKKRLLEKDCSFLVVTFIYYIITLLSKNNFGIFSNFYVPDGQTLHYSASTFSAVDIENLDPGFASYLIYYPVQWIGFLLYYLVNVTCLFVIAKRIGYACLFLIPYYIVSISLPSKDILILTITIIFLNFITTKRWLPAALTALISYVFRDGSTLVMLGNLIVLWLMTFRPLSPRLILVSTLVLASLSSTILLDYGSELWIVSRNLNQALTTPHNLEYGSPVDYLIRLFGNATNLAFRPSINDNTHGVAVLGVSYFISGISMLVCLMYAIKTIVVAPLRVNQQNQTLVILSLFFLISLLIISLNPLVQPRYGLPFGTALLGYLITSNNTKTMVTYYAIATLLVLIAFIAYKNSSIIEVQPFTTEEFTLVGL